MTNAYYNCTNLRGMPNISERMMYMNNAYYNCRNLTIMPPPNTGGTVMVRSFYNCVNLEGAPVCKHNTSNMYQTYYNCYKLSGDAYLVSDNISNMYQTFYGRRTDAALNIYVTKNSLTFNTLMASAIVNTTPTWSDLGDGSYTNALYNITIYTVDNALSLIEPPTNEEE
jgi:hypothetical protein